MRSAQVITRGVAAQVECESKIKAKLMKAVDYNLV
jgi:hypothetical protein